MIAAFTEVTPPATNRKLQTNELCVFGQNRCYDDEGLSFALQLVRTWTNDLASPARGILLTTGGNDGRDAYHQCQGWFRDEVRVIPVLDFKLPNSSTPLPLAPHMELPLVFKPEPPGGQVVVHAMHSRDGRRSAQLIQAHKLVKNDVLYVLDEAAAEPSQDTWLPLKAADMSLVAESAACRLTESKCIREAKQAFANRGVKTMFLEKDGNLTLDAGGWRINADSRVRSGSRQGQGKCQSDLVLAIVGDAWARSQRLCQRGSRQYCRQSNRICSL